MKACLCLSVCKFCCAINKTLTQDSTCQWVGVLTLESEKFGFNSINGYSGPATQYWEAIFFYRVHVDNLILPSQGDRKNSEFGSSQVCNRHNADMEGEATDSPQSLLVMPRPPCSSSCILPLTRGQNKPAASSWPFSCIAFYSENCSNSSDFRQLQGTGTAINTWKLAISGLYIICPFSLCTQRTQSGNYTDRCSHCVLPENHILLKCLTGRWLNRPSRLKHLSVPIITSLKAEEMRARQEESCLSSNLKSWNHKKRAESFNTELEIEGLSCLSMDRLPSGKPVSNAESESIQIG